MRRMQKIMIGAFCSGVFLMGLGTGLTVSEASSFVYLGEKDAGLVSMKTEAFDCTFEPKEEDKFTIGRFYGDLTLENELLTDPELPENTVRFQVTYNSAAVRPYLENEENEYAAVRYRYIGDDFQTFMECKDQILQELKEGKISSYRTPQVKEIKVFVNPASVESIDFFR